MKTELSIGVSGLNAIDSPGPGMAVIRALRESPHFKLRIVGLSYDTLEPGLYMRDLVDISYQLPLPAAGQQLLFDRLAFIQSREQLDFIIPNFDAELFNFIKLEKRLLEQLGIRMFLPTLEQFEARQKTDLYDFGQKYDIRVPKSKIVNSPADVHKLQEHFEYPLVIKGRYYEAGIAYNVEQALSYFYKISAKWGLPIIAQQYVSGTEVNVTALGDGKGNTIGAVPMRKLYITDKGKAWAGISLDDEALLDMSRKLIAATQWRGALELEIICTDKDEYFLLEINPRFPAWVYLAQGAGQNHPEALLRMGMGETLSPFEQYEAGKLFIRFSQDMIVDLADFQKISTTGIL
ncbi:MAG: ATP-grasp domain-containing protein [Bacteroidia bacterium]